MKKILPEINKLQLILLFLCLFVTVKSSAQITGSLFMQPDNFYAQMYNPAFMRTDRAIEISFAGLGGFSFFNQGNFKISDLITTPSGSPVIDIENFYRNISANNYIRQDVAIPMAFVSVPLKKGTFSFYYKENVNSVLKFKKNIFEFLVNGNIEPEYQNYGTDAIKVLSSGYREFAFGYAKRKNKKTDIGIRAKLLFASAFFDANNWNYNIETAADGSFINFLAGGDGHLMLPLPVKLRADSTILSIDPDQAFLKYLTAYQNKGFAVDLGITYRINDQNTFSAAVRDLGMIWYNYKPMILTEGTRYGYIGFDWVHAIRFNEEPGYQNPLELINLVKDSIRNFWQPKVVDTGFKYAPSVKTVLNYKYDWSDNLSFGITDQSAFQKNDFQNILSLSAMQSFPNLSVFESVNLHNVSDVSIGGGIQYEAKYAQLFLATDNVIAFYHPANNKTFNITAGICILLNHEKEIKPEKQSKKGIKKRNGKISPHLPYYKDLRDLKK